MHNFDSQFYVIRENLELEFISGMILLRMLSEFSFVTNSILMS